jgi:hypothetical protein
VEAILLLEKGVMGNLLDAKAFQNVDSLNLLKKNPENVIFGF